jgi:hypothetical protein
MLVSRSQRLASFALVCLSICILACPHKSSLALAQTQMASAEQKLTEEEMKIFLLKAKVVKSKPTPKGVTSPTRLTLSDGKMTHDGGFQSVDIHKPFEQFNDGTNEMNFRDSYQFNIAAYELAKLLGLESMMPVTVARKWNGNEGSLTWWLDTNKECMDEGERIKKSIQPPDSGAWERQMDAMFVFKELVYDKDRNATNALIGPNWELYMIDFSRAFRLYKELGKPLTLRRCSRQLLEKLRHLDAAEVERVTKKHITKGEIKPLMIRRDKIVAYFEEQITQKGESAVLY